tara:strand:+ start:300 stop:686 length:387 start_codon:yes stop_codon:yes gene_type:complete
MNNTQFMMNEYRKHSKTVELSKDQTIADKRISADEYRKKLLDPDWFINSVDNIISGNYGEYQYIKALEILPNKRSNRLAYFGILVALLDHNCPAYYARKVWNGLSVSEQTAIESAFNELLKRHYKMYV